QSFRDGDQDSPSRYRFRYGGVSLRADTELGSMTFMSLSAWRRMRARYGTDLDQGPSTLLVGMSDATPEQFSQEFQLQSSEASRLRWLAGVYYIHIAERYG